MQELKELQRQGMSIQKISKLTGWDRKTCTSTYFIRWNGSNVIPGPIDSYCSDYFEEK